MLLIINMKISIQKLKERDLNPVIINADSNFVVITYWWGKGNLNKNTQRPCPEDLEEGDRITKKPITFDKMINDWKKSCRSAKCNYMAIEYPEFAQRGMYQKAINFKPIFIQEALKACYPRAVLYIDGDMHIKRYPKLFDIKGVDYMAQGWNSDPRYKMVWEDYICYYPYVFETSGGTMYFANTNKAKMILREWHKSVKKYPLKAEDRLISQVFNNQKLLIPTTTIQLPIEYLWLTIDYDYLAQNLWQRSKIYITHPECLTGEDRAFSEGASLQRFPPRYKSQISDQIHCRIKNMPFYEYIFFPTKTMVSTMSEWIRVLNNMDLIKRIPYDKKYGTFNKIYKKNIDNMKKIKTKNINGLIHILHPSAKVELKNTHRLNSVRELIPTMIKYLKKGNSVIYIPKDVDKRAITRTKNLSKNFDMVCRNSFNKRVQRYKNEYTLRIDQSYPLLLRNTDIIIHLLNMSETLARMGKHFTDSFIFPSRISCKWI